MRVQFGAAPSFSQVNEKTIQGIAQSARSFSSAKTASQSKKSGGMLVLRWVGMGFKLMGQGIAEGVTRCFKP